MTTSEVVAKVMESGDADFLREAMPISPKRLPTACLETRAGEIELLVSRKRSGAAYFPSYLEPRRRPEQASAASVIEAYVNGVSTCKVDRVVEQLGI